MPCERCGNPGPPGRWCAECETLFDRWVRRYATDILWATLSGGFVLAAGMLLPLFGVGVGWGMAAAAAIAGWTTLLSSYRLFQRKRRRQFLAGTPLPRAYLPP